ncbi:hypothetical protein BGW41_007041 [Actinomortierella wolfii]|nr:hypothetical protein BGW41_007041 [Actinomortierella wolfii]
MDHQGTESGTLPFDDVFDELPDDTTTTPGDPPAALVVLQSLNPEFATIELRDTKTVLGRQAGEHCKFTTRSLSSRDAPLWITDLSRNGVWVNNVRMPFQEAKKVFDKDVITFVPPNKSAKNVSHPSYMIIDKRVTEDLKQQKDAGTKRAMVEVEEGNDSQRDTGPVDEDDHISKKAKLESKSDVTEASGCDNQIESELECGICHEIMVRPLVLQPCLHSFCRACCKMWLDVHRDCPLCRKVVRRTGRDAKLNNIIEAFLKKHPELAREEEEDEGAENDDSNLIQPRRRNDRLLDHEDEEEEDDDDLEGDEEEDGNAQPIPNWMEQRATECPCCDPNNAHGYVCPDDVRLVPLPQPVTFGAYTQRRTMQPGHTQCQGCRDHLPLITDPTKQDVADKFRCKLCRVPSCGCITSSVEDFIEANKHVFGYLNFAEDTILNDYLTANGISYAAFWQEIKTGMDNGTFYYMGPPPPVAPGARPGRTNNQTSAPTQANVSTSNTTTPLSLSDDSAQNASSSSSSASTSTAQDPTTSVVANADPVATDSGSASTGNADNGNVAIRGSSPAVTTPTAQVPPNTSHPQQPPTGQNNVGRVVRSNDKLCHQCQVDYFRNGPVYQWRKSIDPAQLPPRVTARANCWYGRGCRTQHNRHNPGHAQRLNHICDPSV